MRRNEFDIPFGNELNNYQERVMKNAHVIDVLGNVAVFADVGPVHLAAIHRQLGKYGALLCMSEQAHYDSSQNGHEISLEYSPDMHPKVLSNEQEEVLRKLAETEPGNDGLIDLDLKEVSRRLLPALWYPDIAIVPSGLYFREGLFRSIFQGALEYITETIRDTHTQAHREWNARIRSHLSDLGYDMRQIPQPQLDEQRRQQELEKVDAAYAGLLAHSQTLQLADLASPEFAVAVAKAVTAIR